MKERPLPLVEVEAFGEEEELLVSLLEEVSGPGDLGPAGVLAQTGEAHLLLLHVVAQAHVVEVRGHVDEGVRRDRVPVLGKNPVHKELEPGRETHWCDHQQNYR